MRRIFAALAALALLTGSALADGLPYKSRIGVPEIETSAYKWTGFYVAGGGGVGIGLSELKAQESNGSDHITLDSVGGSGWIGDVKAGLDWKVGNSPWVLGVFVGYNWGSTESSISANLFGFDGTLASLSMEPTWNAGARVGYLFNPATLGYVGYKYQRADLNIGGALTTMTDFCADKGARCSQEIEGHGFLTGVEWKIGQSNWSMNLEYTYTRFEKATLYANEDVSVTATPDHHSVIGRLQYRF